jgi:hypothetical protein
METTIDTSPSSAPPPSTYADTASTPAPDVGNVIQAPPDAPVVDAPRSPITPKDAEVPVDLDHPADAQPDLREVFPQQPAPEQREQPQPQQPQEPQPQLEPLALPPEFAGEEEVWASLPRETQTAINGIVEHVKTKLQPQIEAATAASNAHHEALWGAIGVHSKRAAALVEMARTNPQGLEQLARSPDGQRLIAELGQERAAIQHHGRQIVEQMQEAHRVQSEQQQQHFDTEIAPAEDEKFWNAAKPIISADPLLRNMPEDQLKDTLQDGVLGMLESHGYTEAELAQEWNRPGSATRDARAQAVLLKAFLWDQQQAQRAAAIELGKRRERERSRATPPPLRPGVGGGATPPSATLARAAAEGDMGTYIALRARGAKY